jgi:hypothetical protein
MRRMTRRMAAGFLSEMTEILTFIFGVYGGFCSFPRDIPLTEVIPHAT